jgi:hypothetical protein
MCAALGIPWEDWPKWRDACWLQNSWSASITPDGKAYFCERAGQLDQLYNSGKLGWDVAAEPDWWRRTPEQFGEQLSLCEMCALALPGPSQVDALDRDIIGQSHARRLLQIGSPAVKAGRYEPFDAAKHVEQRRITTKDNYVAASGIRVAADNPDIRPRGLTAIVTCVGRTEHLRQTLAHNAALIGQLIVVTHPDDRPTIDVVKACPAAKLVLSDSCFAAGHAFNKGRMINAALRTLERPDWILLTDADVFLPLVWPDFFRAHSFNPGVLYGISRLTSAGETDSVAMEFDEPHGLFQLFHAKAAAIAHRWPAVMCEEFCSAGGVDSWFLQQFPRDKRCLLPQLSLTHIAHTSIFGEHWNGPPRSGQWRQFAMITKQGLVLLEPLPMSPTGEWRVRLVDTQFGLPWEGIARDGQPLPTDVFHMGPQGIVWLGQPIGHHHIHCAYWRE